MIRHFAKLSIREHVLSAGFVLLLFGYLFEAEIVEPHRMLLNTTSAKLEASQNLLQEKNKAEVGLVDAGKKHKILLERVETRNTLFFSPESLSIFFAGLDNLAASAQCHLSKVDFLSEEKLIRGAGKGDGSQQAETILETSGANGETAMSSRNLSKIRIRLIMESGYSGIRRFVELIGSRDEFINVGEVRLEIVSQNDSELHASIVITLFVLENTIGKES